MCLHNFQACLVGYLLQSSTLPSLQVSEVRGLQPVLLCQALVAGLKDWGDSLSPFTVEWLSASLSGSGGFSLGTMWFAWDFQLLLPSAGPSVAGSRVVSLVLGTSSGLRSGAADGGHTGRSVVIGI